MRIPIADKSCGLGLWALRMSVTPAHAIRIAGNLRNLLCRAREPFAQRPRRCGLCHRCRSRGAPRRADAAGRAGAAPSTATTSPALTGIPTRSPDAGPASRPTPPRSPFAHQAALLKSLRAFWARVSEHLRVYQDERGPASASASACASPDATQPDVFRDERLAWVSPLLRDGVKALCEDADRRGESPPARGLRVAPSAPVTSHRRLHRGIQIARVEPHSVPFRRRR